MGALDVALLLNGGSPYLECGVAGAALAGEEQSGDVHLVRPRKDGALVVVVDGLGHGQEAAHAAWKAIEVCEKYREESVITIARRCHETLIGTRGVAMSLATFQVKDDTMTWLAIGNVEGVLMRAEPHKGPAREAIIMRGGVVGYELPQLRAAVMTVGKGDRLVFATDGIRASFLERLQLVTPSQPLADSILATYGKGTDDALVLVARYLGRPLQNAGEK